MNGELEDEYYFILLGCNAAFILVKDTEVLPLPSNKKQSSAVLNNKHISNLSSHDVLQKLVRAVTVEPFCAEATRCFREQRR